MFFFIRTHFPCNNSQVNVTCILKIDKHWVLLGKCWCVAILINNVLFGGNLFS